MRLRAFRDRALLAAMFASCGRRRFEISNLMHGQIFELDPIETKKSGLAKGYSQNGTEAWPQQNHGHAGRRSHLLSERAALALATWKAAVVRDSGPVFLRISRWGKTDDSSISHHSVNHVLKRRLAELGLDPKDFSAHGVRAGYTHWH